jgi:hypothetical protein
MKRDDLLRRQIRVLNKPHLTYRRRNDSDIWHLCANCGRWPSADFTEVTAARYLLKGSLCLECIADDHFDSCHSAGKTVRSHPFTHYRGQASWPPVWTWTGVGENKQPRGEVGVLKEVHTSVDDPAQPDSVTPYNRVYLFMEYRDGGYIGCLLFDDPAACRQIGEILSQQCGRTIEEVGRIDLSHLL